MNFSLIFAQILIFFGIRPPPRPPVHSIIFPGNDGPLVCATDDSSGSIFDNDGENLMEPSSDQWSSRCGLSLNTTRMFGTKVIGGLDVKINEHPWQVSLQNFSSSSSTHFCGGALIHPKWVITAAHCLEWTMIGRHLRRDTTKRIRVIAGTHMLTRTSNKLSVGVVDVIIYPKYDTELDRNDLALIELEQPIDLSTPTTWPINAVCLPTNKNQALSSKLITTGWGHTRENGHNSYLLKAVELPLVSPRQCKRTYGRGYSIESMICAGAEGKDSCQGDSGGPLIQRDESTGRATLVGIVSIGNGCGRKDYPGIYTKVSYYMDWIFNTISSQTMQLSKH